jgi:hypothetical protein
MVWAEGFFDGLLRRAPSDVELAGFGKLAFAPAGVFGIEV